MFDMQVSLRQSSGSLSVLPAAYWTGRSLASAAARSLRRGRAAKSAFTKLPLYLNNRGGGDYIYIYLAFILFPRLHGYPFCTL